MRKVYFIYILSIKGTKSDLPCQTSACCKLLTDTSTETVGRVGFTDCVINLVICCQALEFNNKTVEESNNFKTNYNPKTEGF